MLTEDFADLLLNEGFFDSLIEYQSEEDNDYDPDEFFTTLEQQAFMRDIKLTDLNEFDYHDFWWSVLEEVRR